MKWVKASERLPEKKGSYFAKEIDGVEKNSLLWYNPEKNGKCLLSKYPKKYFWLEDVPADSRQVVWDKACHATLRSIAATFLNVENQKKAMLNSDKVVFQAIGETIENFPPPVFPPELDD